MDIYVLGENPLDKTLPAFETALSEVKQIFSEGKPVIFSSVLRRMRTPPGLYELVRRRFEVQRLPAVIFYYMGRAAVFERDAIRKITDEGAAKHFMLDIVRLLWDEELLGKAIPIKIAEERLAGFCGLNEEIRNSVRVLSLKI